MGATKRKIALLVPVGLQLLFLFKLSASNITLKYVAAMKSPDEVLVAARNQNSIQCARYAVHRGGERLISGECNCPFELFDIGSITKPLATGLLCAILFDKGALKLDDSVEHFFSAESSGSPYRGVRLAQLLSHTAGFPAWVPLFALAPSSSQTDIATTLLAIKQQYAPGRDVEYSDLGFILLGLILEKILGQTLATAFRDLIAHPLSLTMSGFLPSPLLKDRCAPTERGDQHAIEMSRPLLSSNVDCNHLFNKFKPRDYLIQGEVHDANAHFLGGAAGHAGLFSTVDEMQLLARQFLPASQLLKAETGSLFISNQTQSYRSHRALSWHLASTPNSSVGAAIPPASFGHFAWIGPSIWVDPESSITWSLLMTRAFPPQDLFNIRRDFHMSCISQPSSSH